MWRHKSEERLPIRPCGTTSLTMRSPHTAVGGGTGNTGWQSHPATPRRASRRPTRTNPHLRPAYVLNTRCHTVYKVQAYVFQLSSPPDLRALKNTWIMPRCASSRKNCGARFHTSGPTHTKKLLASREKGSPRYQELYASHTQNTQFYSADTITGQPALRVKFELALQNATSLVHI